MSSAEWHNLIWRIASVVAGSLAAGLLVVSVQLSGDDPINWRPVIVACIGPIVTGLTVLSVPRIGSASIAAQVDELRSNGIQRRDMAVMPRIEHG